MTTAIKTISRKFQGVVESNKNDKTIIVKVESVKCRDTRGVPPGNNRYG